MPGLARKFLNLNMANTMIVAHYKNKAYIYDSLLIEMYVSEQIIFIVFKLLYFC